MSRTTKGYHSRRLKDGGLATPSKYTKKRTHKLERREAKKELRDVHPR